MCGIAGFSLSDAEAGINTKKLTKKLLLGIEHRGKDATGFAFIDRTGNIQVHKTDVTASRFVKQAGRMSVPKGTQNVICHTRFATQGAPERNENNHPIQAGHLVGVHNGCLSNDWTLWSKIDVPKIADVDSAAIFGALAWGTKSNAGLEFIEAGKAPFNDEWDVLENLKGSVAAAWLNTLAKDQLIVARVSSSPVQVAVTEGGSLLFASTAEGMVKAAESVGLVVVGITELREGDGLIVENGQIVEAREFTPPVSYNYANAYRRWPVQRVINWSDEDDYTNSWSGNAQANADRAKRYELLSGNEQWEADQAAVKSAAESAEVFQGQDVDSVQTATRAMLDMDDLATRFVQGRAFDFAQSATITDYHKTYESREMRIDEWMLKLECTTDDAWNSICSSLHAFIRPGDKVSADFLGEQCEGEVVLCPHTYPEGKYVLRLFVHNARRDGNVESVLVERQGWEFKEVEPYHWKPEEGKAKKENNA